MNKEQEPIEPDKAPLLTFFALPPLSSEQDMITELSQLLDAKEAGKEEGRIEGKAELIIQLLGVKFDDLPDWAMNMLLLASMDQLDEWAQNILVSDSIDQVFRAD